MQNVLCGDLILKMAQLIQNVRYVKQKKCLEQESNVKNKSYWFNLKHDKVTEENNKAYLAIQT